MSYFYPNTGNTSIGTVTVTPSSHSAWVNNGLSTYNIGNIASNSTLHITGDRIIFSPTDNKNAIIKTNKNEIDLDKLYETVQLLAERLAVLAVDTDVLAKYPTLRDAYDQYQLLNNLILSKKDHV